MGSSEAGFHGLLQGRRGDASRWARPRRLSAGFSNGGAARSAAVPFCPSLPAARPYFFLYHPPAIGYRVRTPRRCFPLGSSEAATHGSSPLFLRAAAPVRGCSRRISPSISAPLCLPRRPLLCARPFRAGFFGSAPPCSPPPRAVSGPVPARADASRRSFAFSHARRAPFLPCAPCAPGLCASRRGGESCKASCCALLHARPCSCAGGRIAPFFRLSPRTPRAFLALRPLCARPVRIASRRGKL